MPDFITELPSEISTEILTHLSQVECVNCMRVCRKWYQQIPNLANSVWKELNIVCCASTNKCMLRCLGPHVKNVSIIEEDVCVILNKLQDKNCGIIQLAIVFEPLFLLEEELRHMIPNTAKLISTINQFSNTITDISITRFPYNLSVLRLLRDFPLLTYLTIEQRIDVNTNNHGPNGDENHIPDPLVDDTAILPKYNLRYLHLNNITNLEPKFLHILNHCPQLRSLICMDGTTPPNFENIFNICPKIRFLSWNDIHPFVFDDKVVKRWKQLSVMGKNDDDKDKIKYDTDSHGAINSYEIHELLFRGKNMMDFATVFPLLKSSMKTLNHLELCTDIDFTIHWSSITHTKFPSIKSLALRDVTLDNDGWIDLVGHCKNLEYLEITLAPTYERELFDRLIQHGISPLRQLRFLKLHSFFRQKCLFSPGISRNFELLSIHCHQLETIELHNMCINDKILLDLSKIRSLRSLHLGVYFHNQCTSSYGLLNFVDNLIKTNDSTLNNEGEKVPMIPTCSSMEQLTFEHFALLDDQVLECMARIDSLVRLNVYTNNHITDAGVASFLKNNTGGINRKKTIKLLGCPGVSREGVL